MREDEAVRCLRDRRRARGRPKLELSVDAILEFEGGTGRRRRSRKTEANLAEHTRRRSSSQSSLVHLHLHGLSWHLAWIALPPVPSGHLLLLQAILIRDSYHLLANLLFSLRRFVATKRRTRGRRSRHDLLRLGLRLHALNLHILLSRLLAMSAAGLVRVGGRWLHHASRLRNSMDRTAVHAAVDEQRLLESNERELLLQRLCDALNLLRATNLLARARCC